MTTLAGRVALVSGASSGLGEGFARALSDAGAAVALCARRVEQLEAIAAALPGAAAVSMDVADDQSIARGLEMCATRLGEPDIIVANAGVAWAGPSTDQPLADIDRLLDVNLRGAFLLATQSAKRSRDLARPLSIVLIASIAGQITTPGIALYGATKAAVIHLGRSLAREWARYGIAVNVLCPGYVATSLNRGWFASEGGRRQIEQFPRRRLLAADEVERALVHLLGSPFTTGSVLTIDDGQSLV